MDQAVLLENAQAAAEARMADTCVIRRETGTTTDDFSGEQVTTYLQIYAGKCRIQQHTATADRRDVGEDDLLLLRIEVQVPMSVTGIEVGDQAEVTAAAFDADLPGRVFLVHDLAHKTEASARRLQCTERTG